MPNDQKRPQPAGNPGPSEIASIHELCNTAPHALRIADAVRYAGLSRSTLYKLASEGRLEMIRVRGRRLILRKELERLLSEASAAGSK